MAGQNSRTGRRYGNNEENAQAVALRTEEQPPRLPMPVGELSRDMALTPATWKLLTETVYPSAKTVNGIMQAVAYCKARNFDVMKRPVHVVPMWNSQLNREVETVWPGIGEFRTTAARTGQWAGTDDVVFGPTVTKGFKDSVERDGRNGKYVKTEEVAPFDFPLWAQVTVRKIVAGQVVAFVGPKVLFMETFSGRGGLNVPNAMWCKRPFGQLEKCAEAAALRRAFPEEIGEQYTAEEMEGREWTGHNGGPKLDDDAPAAEEAKPAAPTRDSSAEADRRRQRQERFVERTREGLKNVDPEGLERAWKDDAGLIEELDDDLHIQIVDIYNAARERLGMDIPLTDEDINAYKRQFREALKTKQTADELDAFIRTEGSNLDALPQDVQNELDVEIDEHRDIIATLDAQSDDGDGADPSDDTTTTGSEEE